MTPRLQFNDFRRALVVVGLTVCSAVSTFANPYRETFDAPAVSWKLTEKLADVAVINHQRQREQGFDRGAERLQLQVRRDQSRFQIEHQTPDARVFDELTASVRIRSNHPGWVFAVVIVTPGILDPKTDRPAEVILSGDVYVETDRWQQLKVTTVARLIEQKLVLLRGQISGARDPGEMYVDRVVLAASLPAGSISLQIDDLELGPVVPPTQAISPVSFNSAALAVAPVPEVSFRLDRLQVNRSPYFPRLVRHREETPEALAAAGFNTVWIDDFQNVDLLNRLRKNQLWAAATPPQPQGDAGDPLNATSAGLVPFAPTSDAVLCWMLGARLTARDRTQLVHWIEQIEMADRRRARPIAVDILGDERLYSRDVGLLGTSRHSQQTTFSLTDYRDWLMDRRRAARPGAYLWTWIQTEPAPAYRETARSPAQTPHLEPEQIRLQVYAALAAGCRGLGFWTTTPLTDNDPRARERWLTLQALNWELSLMEPWLATASHVSLIPCTVKSSVSETGVRNLPFGTSAGNTLERDAQLRAREAQQRRAETQSNEVMAAVIRTDYGMLLLPMWIAQGSQYQPPQSACHEVVLTVAGGGQTATAWEISTTEISSLKSEPVAGGRQITLPRLDLTAAIWLTSDTKLVDGVRQRISLLKGASAAAAVELAKLKFDRVAQVDQELQAIAPPQPDAQQLLGRAKLHTEQAESYLRNGDAHRARMTATEVMQTLRILQRAHWDEAVRPLTSPVSSPYAVSFQTLPEHWRLIADLGKARGGRNLLPAGDFEDRDTLIAENWRPEQHLPENLRASAELFPTGRSSRYALRLACETAAGALPPQSLIEPAVSMTTPPVQVRGGQVLHISGWVKLQKPVTAHRDGLMIYESQLGKTGAIRLHQVRDWTRFELLREIRETTDWTLTLSLSGLGDILVDDLQVIPQERWTSGTSGSAPDIEQTSGTRLFDRLPKLPRWSTLPPRRTGPSEIRPAPSP